MIFLKTKNCTEDETYGNVETSHCKTRREGAGLRRGRRGLGWYVRVWKFAACLRFWLRLLSGTHTYVFSIGVIKKKTVMAFACWVLAEMAFFSPVAGRISCFRPRRGETLWLGQLAKALLKQNIAKCYIGQHHWNYFFFKKNRIKKNLHIKRAWQYENLSLSRYTRLWHRSPSITGNEDYVWKKNASVAATCDRNQVESSPVCFLCMYVFLKDMWQ